MIAKHKPGKIFCLLEKKQTAHEKEKQPGHMLGHRLGLHIVASAQKIPAAIEHRIIEYGKKDHPEADKHIRIRVVSLLNRQGAKPAHHGSQIRQNDTQTVCQKDAI